ncbi:MAG: hypothetical protein IH933_15225 [Euryarchaeota archaeon]|nr:hypothetical protein [Euryarchaeota archaeon]
MRVKPVPAPPGSIEELETIRAAVPLVPEPEERCRERLVSRTEIAPEDTRDWLAFLRGLGLVHGGESGFYRTREEPDLEDALLSGVYGAREVDGILEASERALSVGETFERFEAIPHWERHHHRDFEGVWRERIERLVEWLVFVGRAECVEAGYASRETQR